MCINNVSCDEFRMNQSIRKETNNNMSPILSEENCKYIGHILTTENSLPQYAFM